MIVGVHSGKFIAERDTANIRDAVVRLGIEHPIVNDRQYRIWRSYAVNAWPTLVLVSPDGYVVGQHAGEATAAQLAPAVEQVIARADAAGSLRRGPAPLVPEPQPDTPLAFPQKVAVDSGRRIAIADTGHDRVLVGTLDEEATVATVVAVVGAGEPGFADGALGEARFHRPHGVLLAGDRLFVADTENHAVREADLASGRVTTLAGTGEQARRWPPRGGRGRDVALNSPWELLLLDGVLYVAMAGSHQLWRIEPDGGAQPWVGSGAEALHDGPPESAALAQPSGLATDGVSLFVADSESSAIRAVSLADGRTTTIVGTGLFDFGDRDGVGDAVRLQHPLGVAWADGVLLVADTYNDRLKKVDPAARSAETWLGGDEGPFRKPGGLAAARGRVFVADSDQHRILVAELGTGLLRELEIRGA